LTDVNDNQFQLTRSLATAEKVRVGSHYDVQGHRFWYQS